MEKKKDRQKWSESTSDNLTKKQKQIATRGKLNQEKWLNFHKIVSFVIF